MNLEQLKGKHIAVLLGGNSPEREVSLLSGATVASALRELGAQVSECDPAEPGWWQALQDCELAFIALHGAGGEDGTLQGALEVQGIRYTGSGVLGSALTMDKVATKRLWQGLGLATADFVELEPDSDWHRPALHPRLRALPLQHADDLAFASADVRDAGDQRSAVGREV